MVLIMLVILTFGKMIAIYKGVRGRRREENGRKIGKRGRENDSIEQVSEGDQTENNGD
jgi:hypothetical protein